MIPPLTATGLPARASREPRVDGSRLLTDTECVDALRGGGVMWIAFLTETGIREVPATYDGSGHELLARPASASGIPAGSVAIATSGRDDRGSWRVVGLARLENTREGRPDVVRLIPTRLLGSSRDDPSEAVGFGSV